MLWLHFLVAARHLASPLWQVLPLHKLAEKVSWTLDFQSPSIGWSQGLPFSCLLPVHQSDLQGRYPVNHATVWDSQGLSMITFTYMYLCLTM